MADRLFVYGSLAQGHPNEHLLADVPGRWEPAVVKGTLHQQGWGAAIGYPALILDEDGVEIPGFVFTSEELARHWQRLDEFEGVGYRRVLAAVTLRSGATVQAHVYVSNQGDER